MPEHFGDVEPYTNAEVDSLCDRLNTPTQDALRVLREVWEDLKLIHDKTTKTHEDDDNYWVRGGLRGPTVRELRACLGEHDLSGSVIKRIENTSVGAYRLFLTDGVQIEVPKYAVKKGDQPIFLMEGSVD